MGLVLLGLPAHQAHEPLIVLAEEPQRLPMAAAQAVGRGAQAAAPHPLRQPGQGPVGPHRSGRRRLPALGAGDRAAARRPAAAQAAAAEVVAALDGHRVLEIVQADGAGELLLEVLGLHAAPRPQSRSRGWMRGLQAAGGGLRTRGRRLRREGKVQPLPGFATQRGRATAGRRPFPTRAEGADRANLRVSSRGRRARRDGTASCNWTNSRDAEVLREA